MEVALKVESVRARWLGHRLHAEMGLALDPALPLAAASKVVAEVKEEAHHHVPALATLTVDLLPAGDRQVAERHAGAKVGHSH